MDGEADYISLSGYMLGCRAHVVLKEESKSEHFAIQPHPSTFIISHYPRLDLSWWVFQGNLKDVPLAGDAKFV